MDPISNADRLVILLRQKLLERSKTSQTASAREKPNVEAPAEPTGIQAMAAMEGADEAPLRRAFIQHLLADQLGPDLINDAQFQQIVSRVTETIEQDPETSRLLSRLVTELRPS